MELREATSATSSESLPIMSSGGDVTKRSCHRHTDADQAFICLDFEIREQRLPLECRLLRRPDRLVRRVTSWIVLVTPAPKELPAIFVPPISRHLKEGIQAERHIRG